MHIAYRWHQSSSRVVTNPAPECGNIVDLEAHSLALIYQAVIKQIGPLPENTAQAAKVIAANAETLGFAWPDDFRINSKGEICDCAGEPFQVSISADRVAVTSASLYGYYFAALNSMP
jgi:hypothetical protein